MPDGSEKFDTPAELITFCPPTARLISLDPRRATRPRRAPTEQQDEARRTRRSAARSLRSGARPPSLARSLAFSSPIFFGAWRRAKSARRFCSKMSPKFFSGTSSKVADVVLRAQRHVDGPALHREHQQLRLLGIDRDGDVVEGARPRRRRRRLVVLARGALPRRSPGPARSATASPSRSPAARARRCPGCRRDRPAAACRPASPTDRPGSVSARCPFCTAADSRRAVADFCSSKSRPQKRLPLRDLLGHRAADDLVLFALADRRLVHVGLGHVAHAPGSPWRGARPPRCPRPPPGWSPSGRRRPPPAGCASRATGRASRSAPDRRH